MIASDPYLRAFIKEFTQVNNGNAYYSSLQGLGNLVFEDFSRNRKSTFKTNRQGMRTNSMIYEKLVKIDTLGQLKANGYQPKSIKAELRDNLISSMRSKENPFEGIYGYEDSVIPDLERAILSMHNINLLGLRGQAKTKIARLMVRFLDEYVPIVRESELNDDPPEPHYKGKP
jgi:hypothetical protein